MSKTNTLIPRISDYLENRQKTNNFGTCKKCSKNVYWSTTKIASHIRSGHCKGASTEEVQRFKQEFIYETPKHLIHRSSLGRTPKCENEDSETVNVKKIYVNASKSEVVKVKRQKLELENEDTDEQYRIIEQNNDNEEIMYELDAPNTDDEKGPHIVYVTNEQSNENPLKISEISHNTDISASKEEKFIEVVYPQFKGRTKLQLIDEIFDLKRRNELLLIKAKTYEETINKLL